MKSMMVPRCFACSWKLVKQLRNRTMSTSEVWFSVVPFPKEPACGGWQCRTLFLLRLDALWLMLFGRSWDQARKKPSWQPLHTGPPKEALGCYHTQWVCCKHYGLSMSDWKVRNSKCSKIQNFLCVHRTPKVENSTRPHVTSQSKCTNIAQNCRLSILHKGKINERAK